LPTIPRNSTISTASTAPYFQSPEAARQWLEQQRWPEGPVCPHCFAVGRAYTTKQAGIYRCAEARCRQNFTVTIKTIMERSHIPLNKWLLAIYLAAANIESVSPGQLRRVLDISYKAADFMCRRIHEALSMTV
jgi:transposase-like protein